jgi:dTDP-4-dehydrorhamnose 3,5-epimerase
VDQKLIEGVVVKEVRSVPTPYGYLTETFRTDWELDATGMEQVFQTVIEPGKVSAWHVHSLTTDRLFVTLGSLQIVLYDSRRDSPTAGQLNEFRFGSVRPALLVIPPEIWHGVHNPTSSIATMLNLVDRGYQYDNPDHFRLPPDTDQIPFRFPVLPGVASSGTQPE